MLEYDIMKYKSMVYKIANKYHSKYLTLDDLFQEGIIGVMYAYNSYQENEKTSFDSWVYNCVRWQILKALRKEINHKDIKICSIYTPIDDEEYTELIELIPDENVKYWLDIEDKLLIEFYVEEFKRLLNPEELKVMLHMFNNGYNVLKASRDLNISVERIRTIKGRIRIKLYKSAYIRNRLEEVKRINKISKIDYYNNPQSTVELLQEIERLFN